MTKKKNHDDNGDDEKMDSTRHHEDRKAKIEAENEKAAEDKEIANFKGLPQDGETRDQLLDRIRKMRETPPPPTEAEVFRSEGMQKEFDAEQEAGRAAVAKAVAEQEKYREMVQKEAAGEKNQAG